MKTWIRDTVLLITVLFAAGGAMTSIYYARVSKYATGTKISLTPDETLASLSTDVTVLCGIVALVGLVFALAAMFGYAELRTSTFRKTEDDLVRIITALQEKGDLTAATAAVLLQSVVPSRVVVLGPESSDGAHASKNVEFDTSAGTKIAEQYPKDGNNGDDDRKV